MELVTGDGRTVRSGARTVKNVTGYDLHRLMTGSLGTLGVITQVALKLRPLPERRHTLIGARRFGVATSIAADVPLTAGVLATPGAVEVRLEGWAGEVDELAEAVLRLAPDAASMEASPFPREPWWTWEEVDTIVEVAVAPSRLEAVVDPASTFAALTGVGLAWIASSGEETRAVRARAAAAGGTARYAEPEGWRGAHARRRGASAAPSLVRPGEHPPAPSGRGWQR